MDLPTSSAIVRQNIEADPSSFLEAYCYQNELLVSRTAELQNLEAAYQKLESTHKSVNDKHSVLMQKFKSSPQLAVTQGQHRSTEPGRSTGRLAIGPPATTSRHVEREKPFQLQQINQQISGMAVVPYSRSSANERASHQYQPTMSYTDLQRKCDERGQTIQDWSSSYARLQRDYEELYRKCHERGKTIQNHESGNRGYKHIQGHLMYRLDPTGKVSGTPSMPAFSPSEAVYAPAATNWLAEWDQLNRTNRIYAAQPVTDYHLGSSALVNPNKFSGSATGGTVLVDRVNVKELKRLSGLYKQQVGDQSRKVNQLVKEKDAAASVHRQKLDKIGKLVEQWVERGFIIPTHELSVLRALTATTVPMLASVPPKPLPDRPNPAPTPSSIAFGDHVFNLPMVFKAADRVDQVDQTSQIHSINPARHARMGPDSHGRDGMSSPSPVQVDKAPGLGPLKSGSNKTPLGSVRHGLDVEKINRYPVAAKGLFLPSKSPQGRRSERTIQPKRKYPAVELGGVEQVDTNTHGVEALSAGTAPSSKRQKVGALTPASCDSMEVDEWVEKDMGGSLPLSEEGEVREGDSLTSVVNTNASMTAAGGEQVFSYSGKGKGKAQRDVTADVEDSADFEKVRVRREDKEGVTKREVIDALPALANYLIFKEEISSSDSSSRAPGSGSISDSDAGSRSVLDKYMDIDEMFKEEETRTRSRENEGPRSSPATRGDFEGGMP